jgi:hypothetical protein
VQERLPFHVVEPAVAVRVREQALTSLKMVCVFRVEG